ncbi:MAG: FkbM family methyltransferase [Anaerolineales bacterium]
MANPLLTLASAAARWLPVPIKRGLYRLGPASRGLRSALNRAAPQGLTEVEVAAGGLAGMRLRLDMQREKDYWLGTYEMELQQAISDFAKPGMVAYDLGANIGYISLLFALAVSQTGQVIAFEALPVNVERLITNLHLNPSLKVRPIAKAVSDKNGVAQFLVHESGGMGKLAGSTGRNHWYQQELKVESITLDDFVFKQENPKPDLIKIDIEGGEALALLGMRRVIQDCRSILFVELHGREAAETVWEILGNAGYSFQRMSNGYPRLEHIDKLGWKGYVVAKPINERI